MVIDGVCVWLCGVVVRWSAESRWVGGVCQSGRRWRRLAPGMLRLRRLRRAARWSHLFLLGLRLARLLRTTSRRDAQTEMCRLRRGLHCRDQLSNWFHGYLDLLTVLFSFQFFFYSFSYRYFVHFKFFFWFQASISLITICFWIFLFYMTVLSFQFLSLRFHLKHVQFFSGYIYTSFIHRTTAVEKINEQQIQLMC